MLDSLVMSCEGHDVLMEQRADGWYSWINLHNVFFPVDHEPRPTLADAIAYNLSAIPAFFAQIEANSKRIAEEG
ncbi:hypothetical protein [Pantanalinema sp. GBBB05]|uniref:hypothetical protein n=1 Tax=Pantanalinema sp. GBBB05 TaxID=2604139 RepID=UPI001D5D65E9|nr:hypothetical protein [Pantanalinema sp. GBBB05]